MTSFYIRLPRREGRDTGLRSRNIPFSSRLDIPILDLFPYPVRGLCRFLFRGVAEEVPM